MGKKASARARLPDGISASPRSEAVWRAHINRGAASGIMASALCHLDIVARGDIREGGGMS